LAGLTGTVFMDMNVPETKTILIVDDEEFIRQSFADYFEDVGWQIIQAESGEHALQVLKNESPDCAIVDIRMGGMDGNKFIRSAHELNKNIVFLICTGSPEYCVPTDLQKFPRVSNNLFKKPITDIRELENELLHLIANKKQEE
jgi:DNA-binding NtrC family response regulator